MDRTEFVINAFLYVFDILVDVLEFLRIGTLTLER